ncbi:TetR/AcrR family transcriptional regulator [Nocardioides sp. SYSU DS0663]|uniref:TetR/AcrR family transcriptional regulator n=1 Tax=Nocardioides sp. SYSU DS0663 TaxID=3416445 RepID=UPI003F4B7AB1
MGTLKTPTRRERQREATYDEIVRVSRALMADGAELSLRAVAAGMGMTAPALYRYVASYQELVDLVAFEVDKAATDRFRAAADELPDDDLGGRLVVACTEFRRWALENPREFGLVFANPVADAACVRREALTLSSSGHLFTGQLRALWEERRYPVPALEELPADVRAAVEDPLIPAEVDRLAAEDRGLLWVFMQGWTRLYGVVALEVFGHMDPRIIESGEMFVDILSDFAPRIGLAEELPRLQELIRSRIAATAVNGG